MKQILTPEQAERLARGLGLTADDAAAAVEADDSPTAPVPQRIGRYRVHRRLASGGMGEVFEAEQDHPRRTVAIKLLRRDLLSRTASRRFQFEVEVLGRLQHPGIAQIYDAGAYDDGAGGRPYFVMEHIPGAMPITAYADLHDLSLRERLDLVARVCDAVHYGHQKGFIHRDLKPDNIIVDADGQPKVIDFGVALATDADVTVATMQTQVGQIIGTIRYMSPEQCAGDSDDLDVRSDVYALGVVLYELLCGAPPYDLPTSSIVAATRVIQEQPPRRLTDVARRLPRDVQTITLKALEKDREKRYQSAAALAEDARRFLAGEPIEARPPTRWSRLVRCLARHPILCTTALCAMMVLLTATAVAFTAWLTMRYPHDTWLSDDLREARILSWSGRSIRAWTADTSGQIHFATLVRNPPEHGGRTVAILGLLNLDGPGSSCLTAFDAHKSAGEPLWTSRIEPDALPASIVERGLLADEFHPRTAVLLDVFPELPGMEIVVSFAHVAFSAACIRIYDLAGNLHYQIWHDGSFHDAHWMPQARLLVVSGLCGEADWEHRGIHGPHNAHAYVVYAIRPERGRILHDWLRTEPGEGPLHPRWYQCLLPPDAADLLRRVRLSPPGRSSPLDDVVELTADHREDGISVSWQVDEHGIEIPGSRVPSDRYRRSDDVPPVDYFQLGRLPPVLPQYRDQVGPGRIPPEIRR